MHISPTRISIHTYTKNTTSWELSSKELKIYSMSKLNTIYSSEY